MPQTTPYKVLFLCSGNSARSILAEYLLRAKGRGRFETYSAGVHPAGCINPLTLRTLTERYGLSAEDARSKSWDEYAGQDFDFLITVCDHARKVCPIWRGQPLVAHWGSPDPVAAEGPEGKRYQAFVDVASQIARRIDIFCAFPDGKLRDVVAVRAVGERFRINAEALVTA